MGAFRAACHSHSFELYSVDKYHSLIKELLEELAGRVCISLTCVP